MPTGSLIKFGDFEVDFETGELSRRGLRVHVQEQPLKVLRVLLDRPGELVSRDDLKRTLAPDTPFGDFDHVLNVAVAKLRAALNDAADTPVYIETLHKRGYRFIVPVSSVIQPAAPLSASDSSDAPVESRRKLWFAAMSAIAVLGLLLAAIAITIWFRRPNPVSFEPVAFTTLQGSVGPPAFSPDGTEIVFPWAGPGSVMRLYVQTLGSTVARRLVDDPDPIYVELLPRWFPNGRNVAYVRMLSKIGSGGPPAEIWMVPRSGGTPRKLLDAPNETYFDLSPDGKTIVMSQGVAPHAASLYLTSLADGSRRQLTNPEDKPWIINPRVPSGDRNPRFSPDGREVAFIRLEGTRVDLWCVALNGGQPERLSDDRQPLSSNIAFSNFTWAADGKSLIGTRRGSLAWWRVWRRSHRWESLNLGGGGSPTLSRDGRLAFIHGSSVANIWRFELPPVGHTAAEPLNLTRTVGISSSPSYAPDGARIVFASNRTGHSEIYVADADGSNQVQLTSFQGKDAGAPRWSPDGKQIAFDYAPAGISYIFVVDAKGGAPRQLTFGEFNCRLPRYSRDGRWIYFNTVRHGAIELWKVPSGGGAAVFVVSDAMAAEESTDGKTLYYVKLDPKQMFARPVSGGREELLFGDPNKLVWIVPFVVFDDGMYYMEHPAAGPDLDQQLMFFDFASRRSRVLLHLPFTMLGEATTNIGISPDRRYFLEPKFQPQSNIMLVENFH